MTYTQVSVASGAVYEFTKDGRKFRRLVNRRDVDPESEFDRVPLRKDGSWLRLLAPVSIVVGEPMTLAVEPLGLGDITMRMTSPVIGVSGDVPVWEPEILPVHVANDPYTLDDTDPFLGLA